MQETIQRYQRRMKDVQTDRTLVEQNMQEKALATENEILCEKQGLNSRKESNEERQNEPCPESNENSDVETKLVIGPPEGRIKRAPQK
ncbi:hypothetical protein Acr_13g0010000 [Actinidia rufa]|uniref:Uncharacterized protein n=1 Tax=Actinidia rufa TaxID=165716 RepID=A0A7J0FLU9_9ERIC|nr:hypothetical protein Acr_13g0010000 [Actinidia rufa]